ncbi:MAG: hypothetical protein K9K62_02770 [Desulfobacteraceae bacterium]|nr:hypothetical protein [Desulfobacteraceae bacterium]
MRKYITVFLIAVSFILASSAANAFDYQDWIPLLPESIGGLDKQGEPEGMNMEKSGQSMSTLKQEYSDGSGNDARLTIVTGTNAPGVREFKTLQKFNMETDKRKVKTLDISGHKAVLDFNKKGGRSSLMIAARDKTLVVIESRSFDTEDALISMGKDVPLSKIADSVE